METTLLPQSIRRTPQQARSLFTADILLEATIRVLLAEGPQRLTTKRVAERAGVSIGTLYQYYENRVALLFAAHQRHVRRVAVAVVADCEKRHGASLSVMVRSVVTTFAEVKIRYTQEAQALYLVTPELTAADKVTPEALQVRRAVGVMLATAADAHFPDHNVAALMFLAAMIGPIRTALERRCDEATLWSIASETVTLCESYLQRLALKH